MGRAWISTLGSSGDEVVLYEADLPACCQRTAHDVEDSFGCPSCGAFWQAPIPAESEGDAFMQRAAEERRGAA